MKTSADGNAHPWVTLDDPALRRHKSRDGQDQHYCEISQGRTIDGDHGRIESRTTTVIHDVEWPQERHCWPGLKAIVMVKSTREISGKVEQDTLLHHLAGDFGTASRAGRA